MKLFSKLFCRFEASEAKTSFNYRDYWEQRYRDGGTSGLGSYGQLAQYKADLINDLISRKKLKTVVEFGCGDGNQLSLMHYAQYIGLDISATAVENCRKLFASDQSKKFDVYRPGEMDLAPFASDLAVSLDVLYHITEEDDFCKTLTDMLQCAQQYAVIYTNLEARKDIQTPHIQWRDTLAYLNQYTDFQIEDIPAQPYPELSGARFFILQRKT